MSWALAGCRYQLSNSKRQHDPETTQFEEKQELLEKTAEDTEAVVRSAAQAGSLFACATSLLGRCCSETFHSSPTFTMPTGPADFLSETDRAMHAIRR
eukprot:2963267-Rhodomonas_salina.5